MEREMIEKIFHILGEKAEKVAQESGYKDEDLKSPEYRKFEHAWERYLSTIGIERVGEYANVYIGDERVWVPDPLHNPGQWVLMTEETAEKILTLGLP